MIQKYIFAFLYCLSFSFSTYCMIVGELGDIDKNFIIFYVQKFGIEKVKEQLNKSKPTQYVPFEQSVFRQDIATLEEFPSLKFTLYFTQTNEKCDDVKHVFCDDKELHTIVFGKIDFIEKNGRYNPDGREQCIATNDPKMPFLKMITCATNRIDTNTEYFHKENGDKKPYVVCQSSFDYEQIKAIQKLI